MTKAKYFLPILLLLFLCIPLIIDNNYLLSILIIIGIYTIIIEGLGILMGYAGQVSFGHAGFFGLGAYTVAILTTHFTWPAFLALILAALFPGLIAGIIGLQILKLRELYLTLATLGFGILIHIVFTEGRELTGGPSGIGGIPNLSLGSLSFDNDLKFFYLVWLLVILITLGIKNLINSRTGRALRALNESEHAAENAGINTTKIKLQAFIFSAILAGFAGGLYASYVTFISPSPFSFHASVQFVLMAVIGGLGTLWGPLIGATVVVALNEILRWAIPIIIPRAGGEFEIVFFGLILVALMIFQPKGIVNLLKSYR